MRVCGNCGYWEFAALVTMETKFAVGVCKKAAGPHHLEQTPSVMHEPCWSPEGGQGPKAEIEPKQIA